MLTPPFESHEALPIFLSQSSKEQFQQALSLFSFNELAESFHLLQTLPNLEAKNKLHILVDFLDSASILEVIGKHFSVSSFISFLDFLAQFPEYQNRLTFILIGLQPLIFSQALHFLQNKHLHILRQEGLLEPLQYQLTQFTHEGEIIRQNVEQEIQQFKQSLTLIQPEQLTTNTLQNLFGSIDQFRNQLLDYLERASTALAIAWNTDRIDLIEKLSSINEIIQHQLTHLIGHPTFDHLPATGLYAFLKQILSNIFDTSLDDEDAAMEGMTRLSIWHLKDYWELGLLPSIQHSETLELDSQKYDEKQHWEHQQKLMSLVQLQLTRLGIEKVKDLKKLNLFSKSLLKTYIEQHHHLLLD